MIDADVMLADADVSQPVDRSGHDKRMFDTGMFWDKPIVIRALADKLARGC